MICCSDIYIAWTKLIAKLGGPKQQPILAYTKIGLSFTHKNVAFLSYGQDYLIPPVQPTDVAFEVVKIRTSGETGCHFCTRRFQRLIIVYNNHINTYIKPRTICTVSIKCFCFTGHEIRSCLEAGTSDICKLCKPGTVQPDYISSNTLNKNCFKPMSSCLAAGR